MGRERKIQGSQFRAREEKARQVPVRVRIRETAERQIKEHFWESVFVGHTMLTQSMMMWDGPSRNLFLFMMLGNAYWGQRWVKHKEYGALAMTCYYTALNIIGAAKWNN